MSCDAAVGSMVALLDGELQGEERREVELHVGACASCATELRLLRATRTVVTRHLASLGSAPAAGSFETLWARATADADVAADSHLAAGSGRVVDLGAARRRRNALWAGAGGFAIAASLALLIVGRQQATLSPDPAPPSDRPAVTKPAPPAAKVVANAEPKAAPRAVAKAPAKQPVQVAKQDEVAPDPALDDQLDEDLHGDETAHADVVASNELDPPRELLERPELFINYPIVRKLDELRHLESVLADTPDDGGAG